MKLYVLSFCLILVLYDVESMEYTSRLKTISDCNSTDTNEIEWSQFEDVAIVSLDETSIISRLVVSSEELCITSCVKNTSCVAVQLKTRIDGRCKCLLLSYAPSTGKVRNQTGIKLLYKGKRSVDNIDTDVSTQCDGLEDCYPLLVDGNVFVIIADKHYSNKLEARNACLNMNTPTGEFDLAILDTWAKITAVQDFMSTIPEPNDLWLYVGGEAGIGVEDPANKWTRTGAAIDQDLWYGPEPNVATEHCVMITKNFNGLLGTPCSGQIYDGIDSNVLCEYFPD